MDSRRLILEVTEQQKKRVRCPIENLAVFVGFQKLKLPERDLHREVNGLLPEAFRMKMWQEVVKETLTESCRTLARTDADTMFFEDRIHSADVINAVLRLVNHQKLQQHQDFTENDVKKVERDLQALRIRKVINLQTVLNKDGSELPNTTAKATFFADRQVQDGFKQEMCQTVVTLYADSEQMLSQDCHNMVFMRQLNKAVCLVTGSVDSMLLDMCLKSPTSASCSLDEEGVPHFHIQRESQQTVFPNPGDFVPKSMHGLLDNDVYEFQPGEYVAFELHDPCLDFSDKAEADESEDVEDEHASDEDNDDNTGPTYIFARVVSVIEQHDADTDVRTKLLRKRYVIDIGEEEPREVGACELYKFVRTTPSSDSTSTQLVSFTGDPSSCSAFLETSVSEDLARVLRDIRQQLRDIWAAFDNDKDRMRAVKRLLQQWHPDKNKGREEFCTKVCQHLQYYVSLLKEGKSLPSDDEDIVDSAGFSSPDIFQSSGGWYRRRRNRGRRGHGSWGWGFFSSFFETVYNRGCSYATGTAGSSGSHSDSSATSDFFRRSRSNPQPEEGRRWMRQARYDLDAARLTLRSADSQLWNWACYQAHQTAEKALKAVAFRRDAWTCSRTSHSILDLACSLGDDQIKQSARELDSLVQYHTRMRYPDNCNFPKIPADVYDKETARRACALAEDILQRAEILFKQDPPPRPESPPPPPPPPPPRPTPSSPSVSSGKRGSYVSIKDVPEPKQRRLTYSSSSSSSSSSAPLAIEGPKLKALPPP